MMTVCARLLLLAVLPTFAGWCGRGWWCADGELVSLAEGGGPAFAPRQPTAIVAAVGQTATLECDVLRLGDKQVLWVRSRDLNILSHAGAVFTADARVSASAGRERHALTIARLRMSDAGRYECQINTEPKMSLFFNLTVVDEPMPVAVVRVQGGSAAYGAAGGAVTLACDARYEPAPDTLPLPALDIRWSKDQQYISLQSPRGGVSLDTERWTWRALSRLTLAELTAEDAGEYTCTAGGRTDSLVLHVYDSDIENQMEAMQRDQSAAHVSHAASASHVRTSLLAAALLILKRLLSDT